jgi:YggT family protein
MRGLFYSPDSLSGALALLIQLLGYAVLARALMSWVSRDPMNPVVRALDTITEPILQPLRQIVPRMGMIDITPMIAIFLLFALAGLVAGAGF